MTTADLLRLPEVQARIKNNFILLPCDLVCELGESLLEYWVLAENQGPGDCQGGLCLYYQAETGIKDEVLDLIAVTPLERTDMPTTSKYQLSKLMMSMGMNTVQRNMEKERKRTFPLRRSFTEKHEKVKILTGYRDAHLYFFPHWVKELVRRQGRIESVGEDLIGSWAKSQWQQGLGEKLGINACLSQQNTSQGIVCQDMSTTVHGISQNDAQDPGPVEQPVETPPLLAYLQPDSAPLVRRVDSPALLLSTSLCLAKIESIQGVISKATPSHFAHSQKIAYPQGISKGCYISTADCLLDSKVIVETGCVIKETCIGPNSKICNGARLTRCVVLDNVLIGECCVLTGCVIGSRSSIGSGSVLEDCVVHEGYSVPEQTEANKEMIMPLFKDISVEL
jgi:translation initiation factor eIF-2B subunit gamma